MKKNQKQKLILTAIALTVSLLMSACVSASAIGKKSYDIPTDVPKDIQLRLNVDAPGTAEERSETAVIDYSNIADGYVMMCYTAETQKSVKAQVKGPETTCSYCLDPGVWAAFPLADGNGLYQFLILENVSDSKYAVILTAETEVTITDEFAPFLRPNQYVDYGSAPLAVTLAKQLAGSQTDAIEIVASIYDFTTNYLSYDYDKAETVKSGYLPDLDDTIRSKKGICFDYASLMTGMLRSLGIPCRLVVGYAGDAYHAWISVWTEDEGWIDKIVYFDGTGWQRMDPTFASAGKAAKDFIGNGDNYLAKFYY